MAGGLLQEVEQGICHDTSSIRISVRRRHEASLVVAYANFLTKVLKVEIWCRGRADYMRLQRKWLPALEGDRY